jgi:glutamine cyclotransferase
MLLFAVMGFCMSYDSGLWKSVSRSPGYEKQYPPQGLTKYLDGFLINNHWNDKKSVLYKMNLSGEVEWSVVLPAKVKHISGLMFYAGELYAANYDDGIIYVYSLVENNGDPEIKLSSRIDTSLSGLSALALMPIAGKVYAAVSDFGVFKKTFIVSLDKISKGANFRESIVYQYMNKHFSQGLAYQDNKLYEACNRLGTDTIYIYDVFTDGDVFDLKFAESIRAPGTMVEDMDFINGYLYTSDEHSFEIYKANIR